MIKEEADAAIEDAHEEESGHLKRLSTDVIDGKSAKPIAGKSKTTDDEIQTANVDEFVVFVLIWVLCKVEHRDESCSKETVAVKDNVKEEPTSGRSQHIKSVMTQKQRQ